MPPTRPEPAGGKAVAATESGVWIVSDDETLILRVEGLLRERTEALYRFTPDTIGSDRFRLGLFPTPRVVVLDVGSNLDRGRELIRRLRRVRVTAPMIVVTDDCSRDFGAKIISEGVRYYLVRDFGGEEFVEVVESLLHPRPPARES